MLLGWVSLKIVLTVFVLYTSKVSLRSRTKNLKGVTWPVMEPCFFYAVLFSDSLLATGCSQPLVMWESLCYTPPSLLPPSSLSPPFLSPSLPLLLLSPRFTTKTFLTHPVCDYCKKTIVIGVKCKHCKWVCVCVCVCVCVKRERKKRGEVLVYLTY